MPSFAMQKRLNALKGNTIGQAHKYESDQVIEATWYNDINAKTAWFYDQFHDSEFDVADNLHPEKSRTKIPVEVKLFEVEYNSLAKDEVAYHLMFKPSYRPNISYYDEFFARPYSAHFPIGLYFDYPNSEGQYIRWLVVGQYREKANQFPTYLALPCDHKLKWVYNKKKYETWCVLRAQSSYNAGIWQADRTISPENQKITWMPINDLTKTIFYDQRVAISQVRDIPVVWKCTKVEDTNVKGIVRYTWKQDKWDEDKDYMETDKDGNIIAMWCDYYTDENPIEPTPVDEKPDEHVYSVITYSGSKAELKVKGGYKKFICTFYRDNEAIDFKDGEWTFTINGEDATDLLNIVTPAESPGLSDNQIKVKFIGSDEYLSSVLTIKYKSNSGIATTLDVAITSL